MDSWDFTAAYSFERIEQSGCSVSETVRRRSNALINSESEKVGETTMKHRIGFMIIFAGIALLASTAFRGTDIARLAPVEVIWLSEREGEIFLETDTGDMGRGQSVQGALEDMIKTVPGTIFLDTADYLMVKEGNEHLIGQMFSLLRPSCMICKAEEKPDVKAAAKFLSAHEPDLTLRRYQVEQCEIPVLRERDGRFFWGAK
jgi:hypothetical protein